MPSAGGISKRTSEVYRSKLEKPRLLSISCTRKISSPLVSEHFSCGTNYSLDRSTGSISEERLMCYLMNLLIRNWAPVKKGGSVTVRNQAGVLHMKPTLENAISLIMGGKFTFQLIFIEYLLCAKSSGQGHENPKWPRPESSSGGTFIFFLNFIVFIFLYSRFLLVIHFIHISDYLSIPISQFITPPPPPATFPPWCPYVCSLHLCLNFCPANWFICTIFLELIASNDVMFYNNLPERCFE